MGEEAKKVIYCRQEDSWTWDANLINIIYLRKGVKTDCHILLYSESRPTDGAVTLTTDTSLIQLT